MGNSINNFIEILKGERHYSFRKYKVTEGGVRCHKKKCFHENEYWAWHCDLMTRNANRNDWTGIMISNIMKIGVGLFIIMCVISEGVYIYMTKNGLENDLKFQGMASVLLLMGWLIAIGVVYEIDTKKEIRGLSL